MAYLIVDLGTSSCRACLVDGLGRVQVAARRPVSLSVGIGGEAEIDSETVWRLVRSVLRDFKDSLPGVIPEALGVSSFLGYVFLSEKTENLVPAVLYQDTRAKREAAELDGIIPPKESYRVTGRRVSPGLLAPILMRMEREAPGLLGKTRWIVGLKDDIVRRLTGAIVTDYAHMNYSFLFDLKSQRLDAGLCDAVGVEPGIFPTPRPAQTLAGRLTRTAALETGLPEGLPVIVGSIDGTTSMYGAGITLEDGYSLVTGTTDVMMLLSSVQPEDEERVLNVNTGMMKGSFAVGGATGAAGGALSHFMGLFGMNREDISESLSETVMEDARDLFVFPGIAGERSPYWTENASGGILGLRPSHGRSAIIRAAMESCAFRLSRLKEVLEKNGLTAGRILQSGGASFPAWNALRADILGIPVDVLAEREATTLGTALFCRTALEQKTDLRKAAKEWLRTEERFEPDLNNSGNYEEKRRKFELLLEDIFGRTKEKRNEQSSS